MTNRDAMNRAQMGDWVTGGMEQTRLWLRAAGERHTRDEAAMGAMFRRARECDPHIDWPEARAAGMGFTQGREGLAVCNRSRVRVRGSGRA